MNAYHERITELFNEYYAAPKDDKPTPNKRIETADEIIEDYIEKYGERPSKSILSRLATYILLDTLTDSHPDKMSREEYPIMSYSQTGRYFARNITLKDIEYSREDVIGTVSNTTKGAKDVLITPDNKDAQAIDWDVFLRQILNDREYNVIIS